jgi:hypothetical protein
VDDYQWQFLALLCHCDGLSAIHAMNLFTAGLDEPMMSDVEMQCPANLQVAMSLAHAFKLCVSVAVQTPAPRYKPRSRCPASGGSTTMMSTVAVPVVPSTAVSVSASSLAASTRPHFHHLSPEEMADKRKKGKCYFCLKKFSPEHKCASKEVFSWNWKTTMIQPSSLMSSVSPCML